MCAIFKRHNMNVAVADHAVVSKRLQVLNGQMLRERRHLQDLPTGIKVFALVWGLWFNIGLTFACPNYRPTGLKPMSPQPGQTKVKPMLNHNPQTKTNTIIPVAGVERRLRQRARRDETVVAAIDDVVVARLVQFQDLERHTAGTRPIGDNCGYVLVFKGAGLTLR